MTTYQVYCDSCGSDHEVHNLDKKKVKFCSVCGVEVDDLNINTYQDESYDNEKDDWNWEEENER